MKNNVKQVILATCCSALLTNGAFSLNGRKPEPVSQNVVLNNLAPSVTREELGEDILKNLKMNPCPISSANDAKLFPKLETQVIFSPNDYLVPNIDSVIFKIPVNVFDIIDLMEGESKSLVFYSSPYRMRSLSIKSIKNGKDGRSFTIYANGDMEPWNDTILKFTNIISETFMSADGEIISVELDRNGNILRTFNFYKLCGKIKDCISENNVSMNLILNEQCYGIESLEPVVYIALYENT